MTQEWGIYFSALINAKQIAIISNMLIWSWDGGILTSDHERIDSSVPDELPNRNDWHPYKGIFCGLAGEWTFLEQSHGVHPPFHQMEFDHTVDRNLMI